ncbi:hypothetical protein [Pseudoalteromonas sp. B62]|uniref:hypothetical protein n=1 Tax=Pseudoalteromonas sp. B62 TaxID=630483 RepID=UPI00301C86A3
MNVLTVELANFLELKTTNFAHLFTQLKLRLLIDIIQKDILPNTELYELFDKIPTNEVYKLLMLPKFWKVVVSCRNCNNYFQDVRQLLANEVYFLSFKPYEYQLNKSDLINEKN